MKRTTQSHHVRVGPPDPLFFIGKTTDLVEQRIIKETGLDARIATIVEPVIEDLGFRLVRVRISGLNGMTVQIMAERSDGTMGIHECEEISKNIAPVLDVEDPITKAYHLEVSSPGIDRPLARAGDFDRWSGHVAKLELTVPNNGRRRYRGTLIGTKEGSNGAEVGIEIPDASPDQEDKIWLSLDTISEAKLIMTDKLMEEAAKLLTPS